jgi:hypothetical protein
VPRAARKLLTVGSLGRRSAGFPSAAYAGLRLGDPGMTRTCDLRFRKPFSAQQCQYLKSIVLQMCCIDGPRQTFGRQFDPATNGRFAPGAAVAGKRMHTRAVFKR